MCSEGFSWHVLLSDVTHCVHVYLLTAGDEVSAFRVCGKTGYSIQVSHHGMNHFPFGQSERKEERLGHVGYV